MGSDKLSHGLEEEEAEGKPSWHSILGQLWNTSYYNVAVWQNLYPITRIWLGGQHRQQRMLQNGAEPGHVSDSVRMVADGEVSNESPAMACQQEDKWAPPNLTRYPLQLCHGKREDSDETRTAVGIKYCP